LHFIWLIALKAIAFELFANRVNAFQADRFALLSQARVRMLIILSQVRILASLWMHLMHGPMRCDITGEGSIRHECDMSTTQGNDKAVGTHSASKGYEG
jgi:hypothetical protein